MRRLHACSGDFRFLLPSSTPVRRLELFRLIRSADQLEEHVLEVHLHERTSNAWLARLARALQRKSRTLFCSIVPYSFAAILRSLRSPSW
jgi:hypothetical protein